MNMQPYELAENVPNEEEAEYICAEILRRWLLSQPAYARILDEIPTSFIEQYLRDMKQMYKARRESLTEIKKSNNTKASER